MHHAIDFFYQYAGHVLRPYMELSVTTPGDVCGVCQRPNDEWLYPDEKVDFINYGNTESHCVACHSLYEGSVELFGVERMAGAGTPVPMKLGMATGCGALITPESVTLYLNGFIKKMGAASKPPFPMVELSGNEAHKTIIANPPVCPEYLYIGNFGRKKADLVSNLALSSPTTLIICEESGQTVIATEVVRQLVHASESLKTAEINDIKRLLRQLYTGTIKPDDPAFLNQLTQIATHTPDVFDALKKMPADPHHRLDILKLW